MTAFMYKAPVGNSVVYFYLARITVILYMPIFIPKGRSYNDVPRPCFDIMSRYVKMLVYISVRIGVVVMTLINVIIKLFVNSSV